MNKVENKTREILSFITSFELFRVDYNNYYRNYFYD